jgi:hypothetical protein
VEVGFDADVFEEYACYVISFGGVKCSFETLETQLTSINVGRVSAFSHRERVTLPNNVVKHYILLFSDSIIKMRGYKVKFCFK